ncbi:MAG TPA: hypothetical protein VF720_08635 [Candidatus Eisenbacteria bacterium]
MSARFILMAALVAAGLVGAIPAGAQLVNPAFDAGPAGPVGNFGPVVGPPFATGFWGAEAADIVVEDICGLPPRSNPFMLQLNVGGGAYSQAWQAVDVSPTPPLQVSFHGWANTCSLAPGVTVGLDIRTFNNPNGWPTHTLITSTNLVLDTDPATWQRVSLNCVTIPADTYWILAQVFLVNATSQVPAYFDDMELVFDECPTPVEPTTWSRVKALARVETP